MFAGHLGIPISIFCPLVSNIKTFFFYHDYKYTTNAWLNIRNKVNKNGKNTRYNNKSNKKHFSGCFEIFCAPFIDISLCLVDSFLLIFYSFSLFRPFSQIYITTVHVCLTFLCFCSDCILIFRFFIIVILPLMLLLVYYAFEQLIMLKKFWTIPVQRNKKLFGRQTIIRQIQDELIWDKNVCETTEHRLAIDL